ncbi:hypothetical protein PG995_013791 [Apiospora arundinis]
MLLLLYCPRGPTAKDEVGVDWNRASASLVAHQLLAVGCTGHWLLQGTCTVPLGRSGSRKKSIALLLIGGIALLYPWHMRGIALLLVAWAASIVMTRDVPLLWVARNALLLMSTGSGDVSLLPVALLILW